MVWADGTLDADSYTANINRLMDAGATGMVAAGCTGEFWAMDLSERAHLAELTVKALRGRGPAITPAIADTLVDLDHVVAIKESSSDWRNFHETLFRVRDRARVFCGPSSVFGVAAVLAGADGLIDCFPNVWAPGCLDLWHATRDGRLNEALALQRTGLALTKLFTSDGRTLYPATKAAMNLMGLPGGDYPRPPLLPLEGPALAGLADGLRDILGADVITTPIKELHHASGT